MKTLQKITLFIALVALFASCQTNTDVNDDDARPCHNDEKDER